jgi:two-component system chemotaxis response regulator CheY
MTQRKKLAFLIVDDSAMIRKMIISALRPLDPFCREASSGLEAIEQLMLQPYDAITLDLNMPDMHGLEFLQFVRAHQAFQKIPVLVITTQNEAAIRRAVLSAGANEYLTKPFNPHQVLERMQTFFVAMD